MVAPLSASLFSPSTGATQGGDDEARKEQARIKQEILSARSEKQCTTCEGDQQKLDDQIEQLETKLRQVQSGTRVEPPSKAESAGETGLERHARPADAAEDAAVRIDPATAERARAAGRAQPDDPAAPDGPAASGETGAAQIVTAAQAVPDAVVAAASANSSVSAASPAPGSAGQPYVGRPPPGLGASLDLSI